MNGPPDKTAATRDGAAARTPFRLSSLGETTTQSYTDQPYGVDRRGAMR
jgi:hypothetical protein